MFTPRETKRTHIAFQHNNLDKMVLNGLKAISHSDSTVENERSITQRQVVKVLNKHQVLTHYIRCAKERVSKYMVDYSKSQTRSLNTGAMDREKC